ncbi:MAG: nucleoside deaminase [Bacteriovoracaceae bacterium]|nr:nucleoside deaminase [Bacteriovoracaceae bacterium]
MSPLKFQDLEWAMGEALHEAEEAGRRDEVPIGACILDSQGKILASAGNNKESTKNPTGHAEILVLNKAAQLIGDWRLNSCTLVVTLEPCLMCMGALWQSRIGNLVFGAYDPKGGALSLNYNVHKDQRLNHAFSVIGGMRHYECSNILSQFFKQKRGKYSYKNS